MRRHTTDSADTATDDEAPTSGLDARLVPVVVACWLCTLVVPVVPALFSVVTAVVAAMVAVAVLALHGRLRYASLAAGLTCLGVAVASTVTLLHVVAGRSGPVPALATQAAVVTVDVRIRSDPVLRPSHGRGAPYTVLDADVERLTRHGVTMRVRTPVILTGPASWAGVEPGERVRAVARLSPTEPSERAVAVLAARTSPTPLRAAGPLDRAASSLRAGLREAVAGLPPNERGLVPALVVGDESRMPPQLVEDFRTAGLSHLTAVSGTNLTILLAFVLGAARWAGLRSWGVPVLGVACALGFVLLARPEPSVLRAAAMGLVGLAGLAVGSRRYGLPALACAVLVLLMVDPWLGRTYGFALSVLATAGIVVLGPPFSDALGRWLPRFLATAVGVPLAAQLACTPVVAILSGSVSVVAVVANLLAAPAVTPATVLGIAATLIAPLSVVVASVPGHLAGYAARWIVEVGTRAAGMPGADLTWPSSGLGVVVLTLLCIAAAVIAPRLLARRWVSVALAGVLGLWIVHPVRLPVPLTWITGWPPAGWLIVACDVGQGDALVLRSGPGTAVVVDTGPDPDAVDQCLRGLGVRRVPYVLLTHFHADHTSGLPGVLRGREVGEIGIRPGASSTADRVRAVATEAGVEVVPVAAGELRRVGGLSWTVLGPTSISTVEADSTIAAAAGGAQSGGAESGGAESGGAESGGFDTVGGEEGSAENDASVVVVAETQGVRVLLTGDVEPSSQRRLLRSGVDLRASILKVPHHGSRYQDTGFLRAVAARVALISVGADNDYGHPAPSAINELTSEGARVVRTDLAGSVAVVKDGAGLAVVTHSAPR